MSVPNPLGLSRASGLETLTLHSTSTVSLNAYCTLEILRATWICTIWDSDLAPCLSLNVQLYIPVWCREADAVTKPKWGLKESWSCSWARRLLGAWLSLSPETLCALWPINTLVSGLYGRGFDEEEVHLKVCRSRRRFEVADVDAGSCWAAWQD